jgi:hypothetical protein
MSKPLWQVHCIQFHCFWKLTLVVWLENLTANSANYIMGFGATFLWNPYLSLCSHVQNFCHEQWTLLLCCQGFQFSGRGGGMVWKILNTCGLLCIQWSSLNLLKGRQLLLAQTLHPRLLHSVIVIGFSPMPHEKRNVTEHMMFIMRIDIISVQFWHLHRVIRKGLASWKCKYPIYLETYFNGVCCEMFSTSQICCFLPAVHMCVTHWHSYISWM